MTDGPNDEWDDIPFDDTGDDGEGGFIPPSPWGAPIQWEPPPEWDKPDWSGADTFEDVPDDEFDPDKPPENTGEWGYEPEDFGDNYIRDEGEVPEGFVSRGFFSSLFDIAAYVDDINFLDFRVLELEWGIWEVWVDEETQKRVR